MYLPQEPSAWSALTLPVVFGFWNFIIPAVASLLGRLSGGRAQGREAQAQANASQDVARASQYNTAQQAALAALQGQESGALNRAQLDLAQRNFGLQANQQKLQAPALRASNAVRGDILSRAQDVSVSHPRANVQHIQGGLRPSMLSNETRQLGQSMTRDALMQQLAGDNVDTTFAAVPQQNWQGAILPPPGVTAQPTPNGFDKFLSVAAPIAGIASAVTGGMAEDRDQKLLEELMRQRTPGQQTPIGPVPYPPMWPPQGTMGG